MKYIILMCVILLAGCAGQKKVIESQPIEIQKDVPILDGVIPSVERYFVERGDTLWDIAATKYGDAFQWPLIWMANKDIIADPDIIEVGQNLAIPRHEDPTEAIKVASDWPPYSSHGSKLAHRHKTQ